MNKVVKIVSIFRGCCKMRIYTCIVRYIGNYICINSIHTLSHMCHGIIWHRLGAARNIKKSSCFRVAKVPGKWHKILPNPTVLDCQPRAFFTWCFALTKLCYQVKGILVAYVPEISLVFLNWQPTVFHLEAKGKGEVKVTVRPSSISAGNKVLLLFSPYDSIILSSI